MKKGEKIYCLDYITPISKFNFNNENELKSFFSADNLILRSRKREESKAKIDYLKDYQDEEVNGEISWLLSGSLVWILEHQGEPAFRNAAKYLEVSEEEIYANIKIWRGEMFEYLCDMACLKIMVPGGSIFFDNHFGDGIYEVYICKEEEIPKKAEFEGHFTIFKKGWLMRYDCNNREKLYQFNKGRYFVYLDHDTCAFYIHKIDEEISS